MTNKEVIIMFKLPDLTYDYDALEPYIDKETMQLHHQKHHGAYVKNLNEVLVGHEKFLKMDIAKLISSLEEISWDIRVKVRNNAGGHFNHNLFWTMMTPGGSIPSGKVFEVINKTFGGFEKFKEKFSLAALGRFGSGWAWLVVDGNKLEIMDTPNQDSPLSEGKTPILGIDVWEHAYYLKYQNRRGDYIKAWWNVVNWREVENRFLSAI